MLKDAGASYVIVGHSERRTLHHETDALVRAKAEAALKAGLTAIVCVGETRAEREAGEAIAVVARQVLGSMPPGRRAGDGRRRLRAGLGDRHRPHADARRRRRDAQGDPEPARRDLWGRRRENPHSLRRLGEAGERARNCSGSTMSTARWSAGRA